VTDAEFIRIAEEAIGEIGWDCRPVRAFQGSAADLWCVVFGGQYGTVCIREQDLFDSELQPVPVGLLSYLMLPMLTMCKDMGITGTTGGSKNVPDRSVWYKLMLPKMQRRL
jgi:hypothetical protein